MTTEERLTNALLEIRSRIDDGECLSSITEVVNGVADLIGT